MKLALLQLAAASGTLSYPMWGGMGGTNGMSYLSNLAAYGNPMESVRNGMSSMGDQFSQARQGFFSNFSNTFTNPFNQASQDAVQDPYAEPQTKGGLFGSLASKISNPFKKGSELYDSQGNFSRQELEKKLEKKVKEWAGNAGTGVVVNAHVEGPQSDVGEPAAKVTATITFNIPLKGKPGKAVSADLAPTPLARQDSFHSQSTAGTNSGGSELGYDTVDQASQSQGMPAAAAHGGVDTGNRETNVYANIAPHDSAHQPRPPTPFNYGSSFGGNGYESQYANTPGSMNVSEEPVYANMQTLGASQPANMGYGQSPYATGRGYAETYLSSPAPYGSPNYPGSANNPDGNTPGSNTYMSSPAPHGFPNYPGGANNPAGNAPGYNPYLYN